MRVATGTSFSVESQDSFVGGSESFGVFDCSQNPQRVPHLPRSFAPDKSGGSARVDSFSAGGPARASALAVGDGTDPEADLEVAVKRRFAEDFSRLARDPAGFHALMRQVYGDGYDGQAAEQLRQRALEGDFSWLPDVQLVDADTLGGANGAYHADASVVYLNRALAGDVETLAQTYLEEAGHHLDTKLSRIDTRGDEGELFRRLVSGERLTEAQAADIQAEDDHGTIVVEGRTVQVEFWNPFKAIAKAAQSVGNAVVGAAKAAVGAVTDAAVSVGTAAIWQFQNGGTDYAGEALMSQWWGKGYDWRQSVPSTPWGGLEPEQQDAFLNFAYENGAFNSHPPVLVVDYDGDGVTDDLTSYLRAALEDIRRGRGTP